MESTARSLRASVIILSWNGTEYLEPCLNAVLAQDYAHLEVIVVDNGSTDGSADLVARLFPQVKLIRNECNLGFAAGNNVGLSAASGDLLVLLNQDTEVHKDWLKILAETALNDTNIGIVGGKAVYPDGTIQHAGGWVGERGQGGHHGHHDEDVGQFDQTRDVDYVTGATLAIARRAFESIGGLDEGFAPAYYEDVDWCYRARQNGFRVVYAPQAVLVHKEASSIADLSHEGIYLQQRHRLRFVLKHWPLQRLAHEFLDAERTWLLGLRGGGERLIAAVHHAYLFHLLNLGQVMASRQELLGAPVHEADAVAGVLLTLRSVVPPPAAGAESPSPTEILEDLHQRWAIKESPFHSEVPVFGRLIAAFRHQWNRVSTEWYVRPMIQQQIDFNALLVTLLQEIVDYQRRLDSVLPAYLGENGREIAELAREVHKLKELLAEQPDAPGRK
jgi:GT2 family glycosyltransferase